MLLALGELSEYRGSGYHAYISFGIIKLEQNALPLLYIRNIYKILANLHFSAE